MRAGLFIGFLLCLLAGSTLAQKGLFVNDNAGGIRIMPNTTVYVDGDFQILNAFPNPINKLVNGKVIITGNLVTNDSLYCETADSTSGSSKAVFQFTGSSDSYISGTARPQFYQLVFDKSGGAKVYIENEVNLLDTVTFISGNAELLDSGVVNIVYRQGTNSVPSNPWIANETGAHRFTGNGTLKIAMLVESSHEENLANTGFHYSGHGGDSLILIRGHQKQLYAGNGSIDRYFDVEFRDNDLPTPDTITLYYIPDVDYLATGVDTARLGIYLSEQFQDIDYRRIDQTVELAPYSISLVDVAQYSLPTVDIPVNKFRITAADTLCSNPPVSGLPDTLIHLCVGDSLEINAANAGNSFFQVSYFWQDSVITPTRFISATNSQQDLKIRLYDTRGCYSIDTLHIAPVEYAPIADFDWDDACLNLPVEFFNETSDSLGMFTSEWNFGDGNTLASNDDSLVNLYAASGLYSVTLTNTSNYGCVSDTTHDVKVFDLPVAAIESDHDCFQNTVFLDGTGSTGTTAPTPSIIVDYSWKIDGLPQSADPSFYANNLLPGNHIVELIVRTGVTCRDTLAENLVIFEKDTASFTVSNACAGAPLTFNNTSYTPNGNAVYHWIFNSNGTSSAVNPQVVYSTPGIYSAQLIVETDANCADTFSLAFEVYGLPQPDFNSVGNCAGTPVSFVPSVITSGSNYSWDFGDSNNSNVTSILHSYSAPGTYNVQLSETSADGCTNTIIKPLIINALPVASFAATSVCLGESTQFSSTSSGSGLTYNWNFGDFTSGTDGPVTSHEYATSGLKTVQLQVTNSNGCVNTVSHAVEVYALPVIPIGNVSTCGDQYVLNAGNPGSGYVWSPGNNTTQNITVTNDGTYSVTVTDPNGCVSSASAAVVLNSVVQPDLGMDQAVCGSIVLDAGYTGSAYLWNDLPGSQTYSVNTAGTYWVSVTDQNSCTGSDTIVITDVYQFTEPDLGADLNVCYNNFPVGLAAGAYAGYVWNTGSTSSDIQANTGGLFWVNVTDANGCTGADSVFITAMANPVSDLPATVSGCDNVTVIASSDLTNTFAWSTAETANAISVTASGIYSVVITNANGCTASDAVTVTINPSPSVDLGPDLSVCSNAPVTLSAGNNGSTYSWTSTSGAVLSTNQSFTPLSSGTYIVSVSSAGCSAQDAVTVTMLPSPVIPVQPSVYYICGTTDVTLTGCTFGTNNWTSNGGFVSSDPVIAVHTPDNYTVTSFVGSCSATRNFELITSPQQIEAFYLVDSDTTKNLSIKFIDLSEPEPVSYLWDFGDGTFGTEPNPVHTYSVAQIYHTSLTVSNGFCVNTFTKDINQKLFFPQDAAVTAPSLEMLEIKVYPNPFSDNFYFETRLSEAAKCKVTVFNVLGQNIFSESFEHEDEIKLQIPMTEFSNGSYFLRFEAESLKGNLLENFKLIKSL